MIIENAKTYGCCLKSFSGEQYNLPVDKIYFLESRWDFITNRYVQSHQKELQEILNKHSKLFKYELIYLSRSEISSKFLSLYPQIKEEDVSINALSSDELNLQYKRCRSAKHLSNKRQMSFVSHIAPNEQSIYDDNHVLYFIDIEEVSTDQIPEIFENYVDQVESYSRDSLLGLPILYPDEHPDMSNYDIHFSIIQKCTSDNDYPYPAQSCDSAVSPSWFSKKRKDDKEIINVDEQEYSESDNDYRLGLPDAEDLRKYEEEKAKRQKEEEQRDAKLREIAYKVRDAVAELQRENGITILSEILGKELLEQLRLPLDAAPSKLVVDDKYNILLPEYDRKVSMPTLSKTLYFLFLRHPEGFRLVDIDGYKDELRTIYFLLSPRQSIIEANRSIDDLTNIEETDSMRQKLCRLNKAFRDILSEDLASNYMVSGERGEARRIRLLPEQIVLPNSLKF